MITFDGDRSLKRRWFAKKKLAAIKEMDIPSACPIWDGFRFKVWQLGDIDGGRVTAPMGAVVACSTQGGIKVAVADYWAGGFNPAQDLYVIFKDLGIAGDFTTFFNGPIDPTLGYYPVKFMPAVSLSPYGLIDGDTEGPDTVWTEDYSCGPVLLPFHGELFNVIVSDSMKYDLAGDGVFDWWRQVFEKNTSFYIANGSQASRMNCIAKHIEYENSYTPWRIYQKTGEDRYTSFHSTWLYDFVGSPPVKTVGFNFDVSTGTADNIYFSEILNEDMPEALRTILVTSANDGSCEPLGSYAFDNTFFHAVNASCHVFSSGSEVCEASVYYDDNPDAEKWRLFYSMTVGGIVYLVNSSQFLATLDGLTTFDLTASWFDAKRMFEQVAGAYPNVNFTVPYDSVMFHAHDGIIYTWTRKYGAVKFTTTGLYTASMVVPADILYVDITAVPLVEETGVRPDITYSGTFETIPLYLCVCNKVKERIKSVHYGSPFTGWTQLPGCSEGVELISVRPCVVTLEKIFLIGVVKYTVEEIIEGVPTEVEKYSFASLNWTAATDDEEASTEPWRVMGELPFPVGSADNFALGLYGDDPRCDALAAYQCPPIVSQSPVGPYEKYAIGMP